MKSPRNSKNHNKINHRINDKQHKMISEQPVQPAIEELVQEIALNCCEVVLNKKNGQKILDLISASLYLRQVWNGDVIGSFDDAMQDFNNSLERMISWDS